MKNNIQIMKVFFFAVLLNSSLGAAENLIKLEQLVAKSNYEQAWQQAQQLVKQHEGEPRFDYLYGISALETGHYDVAVFALDRVTVNQPNVIRPRLELARAYLKVNNDIAALREFIEVLRLDPPATVRRHVNHYIQILNKSSDANRKQIIVGLITLATGYDSNANFGADGSIFDTPVFGPITLKNSSVKQDSPFAELRTQLNYRYINSDRQSWFVKTKLHHKHFTDSDVVDISELNLQGGSTFVVGKQQYQFSLRNQFIHIDQHAFSNTLGLKANITHELADDKVLSASLLFENYDHKQQNLRDARRYGVSGNYRFSKHKTRHQLGVSLGNEQPKHKAGKNYTRNTVSTSYSLEHAWDAVNSSFISGQFQYRKHRAKDPIYAKKRQDKRVLFKVGHHLRLGKNLSVFAQLGYTKNNSNLDIYDTDKAFAQTGINYNF